MGIRDDNPRDALAGIVSVRLGRAARRTEALLRRIDALEQRVKELEAKLDAAEPKAARGSHFRRVQHAEATSVTPTGDAGEGARVVASQMLAAGIPPERVAKHLQDVYDLPDAERVVAGVARDDR